MEEQLDKIADVLLENPGSVTITTNDEGRFFVSLKFGDMILGAGDIVRFDEAVDAIVALIDRAGLIL